MKIYHISQFKGGWFVGNFTPTVYKNKSVEVCYKYHNKGERWPTHYHKESIEINYLIRGKMKINDVEIIPGQIFLIEPEEIARPEFLEDCELIVVKAPSTPGDKYEV